MDEKGKPDAKDVMYRHIDQLRAIPGVIEIAAYRGRIAVIVHQILPKFSVPEVIEGTKIEQIIYNVTDAI